MKISQPLTSGMPATRTSKPPLSASQISQRVRGSTWPTLAATMVGARPKITSLNRPSVMKCTRIQRRPLNHGASPRLENDESHAASTASAPKSKVINR